MAERTLSHTVFDEKLIHRYLFERFYEPSDRKLYQKCLPKSMWSKRVNVMIPEAGGTGKGARPDLELYFTDDIGATPVEVKWDIEESVNRLNQLEYIHNNDGFYASFTDLNESFVSGLKIGKFYGSDKQRIELTQQHIDMLRDVEKVTLDEKDFIGWLSINYERLFHHQIRQLSSLRPHHWLVVLKNWSDDANPARINWRKMRESPKSQKSTGFWAFRQKSDGIAFSNCMNMRKGDIVLFAWVRAGTTAIRNDPSSIRSIEKAFSCELTADYFVDMNREYEGIFEDKNKNLNNSEWPHYIKYKFQRNTKSDSEPILYTPKGHLSTNFAKSFNRGTPIPITQIDYESIVGTVRMIPF